MINFFYDKKILSDWYSVLTTLFTWVGLCLLLFFHSAAFSTEISDYTDCTNIKRTVLNNGAPLTKAERIMMLEADYIRTVSQTDRCKENERSATGGSSGGAAGSRAGVTQVLSKNAGVVDDTIMVDSSLRTDASTKSYDAADNPEDISPGKDHEELQKADNKAALLAQIKMAADKETDPEVKKILMEKYESLK